MASLRRVLESDARSLEDARAELLAREARALQLAASHFGLAGVGAQLQAWLLDEPSDLLCTHLPSTVRDEEAYPAALALGAAGVLLAVYACAKCCASRRCAAVDSMNSASRVDDSRTELTLGSRDEQWALQTPEHRHQTPEQVSMRSRVRVFVRSFVRRFGSGLSVRTYRY